MNFDFAVRFKPRNVVVVLVDSRGSLEEEDEDELPFEGGEKKKTSCATTLFHYFISNAIKRFSILIG